MEAIIKFILLGIGVIAICFIFELFFASLVALIGVVFPYILAIAGIYLIIVIVYLVFNSN